MMRRLVEVIDRHAWEELPGLLHDDFTCRLMHTGEAFGKDEWVRFNADYPGFVGMRLEDCVAQGDRAAARYHVEGVVDGEPAHFEVAGFLTVRDDLIVELVEVWTDIDQDPPAGTRSP